MLLERTILQYAFIYDPLIQKQRSGDNDRCDRKWVNNLPRFDAMLSGGLFKCVFDKKARCHLLIVHGMFVRPME
jgi:hypothetical protein